MKRLLPLSTILASTLLAATAYAHHGWNEYDAGKPLTLTGTISSSGYTQPHGYVELDVAGKTWHVVLAPPSRMESRGLPKAGIAPGGQATVYGYPHRTKAAELRAERITVGDKTTELR